MKHLKMLGLVTIAAAALVVSSETASAATFTAPAGTAYAGSFDMSLEGSLLQKYGFAEITCTQGTIQGNVVTNNDTEAVVGLSEFRLSNCGSATADTLNNKGTLRFSKSTTAVSATGVELTIAFLGTSCVYGFGNIGTALGTATNNVVEGQERVTLAISAKLPKISGGFLCASPASWTASYVVTNPGKSVVD